MAKKHLLRLKNGLYENLVKDIEELEKEISFKTRETMVDPESVEEAVSMLREVCTEIQNIGSCVTSAISYPNEFLMGHSSINNMVKVLYDTIDKVREQEPESPLIAEYEKSLLKNLNLCHLYNEVKRFRDFPSSKKKFNSWVRRGWINPGYFTPVKFVWESIKTLRSFIDEEL